jgi:small-conductance mechanosensitive channel|tara:strand:+ start:2887 stop:3729 length:843 start_codon:yes stop_codon:yes gene_type:complete
MFENFLMNLTETARIWMSWALKASVVIIILIAASLITKGLNKLLRKHMKGHIEPTVLELTELIMKAVIYIAAVLIVLSSLGIKGLLMPMLTSAGVLGIVLGFAMRDSLSNVFAGIALFMDEPFKIGDMVQIGELSGKLYDIGLRSTQIKTFDNNLIILPNNFVAESHIINYSKSDPKIRVNVNVSISYESNIDKAKKVLIELAEKNKNVMKDPAPDIRVEKLGDSGIEICLRVWIPNSNMRKQVPSDLRYKILKEFAKNRIEIPYPRRYIINGGKAKKKR